MCIRDSYENVIRKELDALLDLHVMCLTGEGSKNGVSGSK